jgi:hypothetical protein
LVIVEHGGKQRFKHVSLLQDSVHACPYLVANPLRESSLHFIDANKERQQRLYSRDSAQAQTFPITLIFQAASVGGGLRHNLGGTGSRIRQACRGGAAWG